MVFKTFFIMEEKMKRLFLQLGSLIAMASIVAASLNVNSTCAFRIYQDAVPDSVYKLRKLKEL